MPDRIEHANQIHRFNHLYQYCDQYCLKLIDEDGKTVLLVFHNALDDEPALRFRDSPHGSPWVVFKGADRRPMTTRKASLEQLLSTEIPRLLEVKN